MKSDELLLVGAGIALLFIAGKGSGTGNVEYIPGDGLNQPPGTLEPTPGTWRDAFRILADLFRQTQGGGSTESGGLTLPGSGGSSYPGTPPINSFWSGFFGG